MFSSRRRDIAFYNAAEAVAAQPRTPPIMPSLITPNPPAPVTKSAADAANSPASQAVPFAHAPAGIAAAWMLAKREWVRFFRQRNRVVSAVVQPLLFWVLFGTGLSGSFQAAGDQSFMAFFLPGTIALIVLFTAIFSTISVIEDRREGFMQSVLVAPVGRWPVLAGKVLGGTAIAWAQSVFFLLLVYAFGSLEFEPFSFAATLLLLAVMGIAMCSLGMIVAWPMDSTQGFHAIMMLGLMPMWLLSGSFFPIPAIAENSTWGQTILGTMMRANPLSYSMTELRRLLYIGDDVTSAAFEPSAELCWGITIAFALITTLIAWRLMRGSRRADLAV